jgi:hypothetical protein
LGSQESICLAQREAGPFGVIVEPLGEPAPGLRVLPDGLLALGELMVAAPVVPPAPMPEVLPADDPPVAAPALPAPALPPAAPAPAAKARVLDRANADARTSVLIFMICFLWVISHSQRLTGCKCSRAPITRALHPFTFQRAARHCKVPPHRNTNASFRGGIICPRRKKNQELISWLKPINQTLTI